MVEELLGIYLLRDIIVREDIDIIYDDAVLVYIFKMGIQGNRTIIELIGIEGYIVQLYSVSYQLTNTSYAHFL